MQVVVEIDVKEDPDWWKGNSPTMSAEKVIDRAFSELDYIQWEEGGTQTEEGIRKIWELYSIPDEEVNEFTILAERLINELPKINIIISDIYSPCRW